MATKKMEWAGLIGWARPNADGIWSTSSSVTNTGGSRSKEKSNLLQKSSARAEISRDMESNSTSWAGMAARGLNAPILTSSELTTSEEKVNTAPSTTYRATTSKMSLRALLKLNSHTTSELSILLNGL